MTKTIITDEERIKSIIRETFEGDVNQRQYFIWKTHEDSIKDTFEKNKEARDLYSSHFYELTAEDGRLLGFINIIPSLNMLFSFGLKQEERTEENKRYFIQAIEEAIPNGDIACSLYSKNTRGIRFLENNGFSRQENTITLVKKRE